MKHNNVADSENVYEAFLPVYPLLVPLSRGLLLFITGILGRLSKAIEKDIFSSSSALLRFLALFPARNSYVKRRNRFCTR